MNPLSIANTNWDIVIAGDGRCNVTHTCFYAAQLIQFYPRDGDALRGAFSRFQPKDTVEWFETRNEAPHGF